MISVDPFFGDSIPIRNTSGTMGKAKGVPRFFTSNIVAARGAARAGAITTLLPEWLAAPEIRAGALIHLLPDWAPKAQPLSNRNSTNQAPAVESRAVRQRNCRWSSRTSDPRQSTRLNRVTLRKCRAVPVERNRVEVRRVAHGPRCRIFWMSWLGGRDSNPDTMVRGVHDGVGDFGWSRFY